MPNLFRAAFSPWLADADAENAQPGTILRSDNLVLDAQGALCLRQGSETIYPELGLGGMHTIESFEIAGRPYVFSGVGKRAFRNGIDFGADFDGNGDFAIGSDSYQVFVARGTTGKKYDGQTVNNWGIRRPELAPTLTASTAVTKEFATFTTGEGDGGFVVTEGSKAFISGWDGTANGATELTVTATTGRASAYKKWSSDQDMIDVLGTIGSDTDLYDMYSALSDPLQAIRVTVMFGLNTGTDPFVTDYYSFDFNIKDGILVDLKDAPSSAPGIYQAVALASTQTLSPKDITDVKTPEEVIDVLARLGRFGSPVSRERADAIQSSPAWGHFATTRGQFNRIGQTSGRDWHTVRGFKVVVQYKPGFAYTASFDSTIWYAGGPRALTGTFRVGYRYARNFSQYPELSPISPISDPITLNQQGLNIFIPAAAISGADPQVDQIWIYFYSDFIGAFYRVLVVSSNASSSTMSIDEFDPTGDASIDTADRMRFLQFGLTVAGFTPNLDLTISLQKSEIEALQENVRLEPGSDVPPDDIIAIAGPLFNRMFALTKEGWLHPSLQNNPSSFSTYHALDLRRFGVPRWLKLTTGGLHAGLSKDVVRIAGDASESDDRARVNLYADPLNVANPPVDGAIYGDGNTLIYRAADGLWSLAGQSAVPVSSQGVSLLWRGIDRHGIGALDIKNGRFRLAIDNQMLYMLAPEGSTYRPPGTATVFVEWTELTGLTEDRDLGTLTKTAISGFGNTSAIGRRILTASNGYMEVTVGSSQTGQVAFGLTNTDWGLGTDSGGDYTKIDFAIMLDGDVGPEVRIYENGVSVPLEDAVPLIAGDVLRVEVYEGFVYYKRNGAILFSRRLPTTSYPMAADTAFKELGTTLGPIVISGNWMLVHPSTRAVWRYELGAGRWARLQYPFDILSISRGHDGAVLCGDVAGNVREIDVGTQDDETDIAVNLLTSIDSDASPFKDKSPLDLQVNADTAGNIGTVNAYVNGSAEAAATFSFSGTAGNVYRQVADSIGDFARLQLGITGSFFRFVLRYLNVSYRDHPQQVMQVDTGYLTPPNGGERAWITKVEVSCKSPVDLEVVPTFDDVEKDAITLPVVANKTSIYSTLLKRGQDNGRRPLILVRTTNAAGQGNVGFEPYWIRIHFAGTGNRSQIPVTINVGSIAGGASA